jgi:hypothetical protein
MPSRSRPLPGGIPGAAGKVRVELHRDKGRRIEGKAKINRRFLLQITGLSLPRLIQRRVFSEPVGSVAGIEGVQTDVVQAFPGRPGGRMPEGVSGD